MVPKYAKISPDNEMLPLAHAPFKSPEKTAGFQVSEDAKHFTAVFLMGELMQEREMFTGNGSFYTTGFSGGWVGGCGRLAIIHDSQRHSGDFARAMDTLTAV